MIINLINKQLELFITTRNEKQLIWFTEKHNSLTIQIDKLNLVAIWTIFGLFFVLNLALIIPLNLCLNAKIKIEKMLCACIILAFLCLKTNIKLEKMLCACIILAFLCYGFFTAYLLSTVIKVVHKLYKRVYKILQKQNFIFNSKRNFQFNERFFNFFI